jgi:hypothetical protein
MIVLDENILESQRKLGWSFPGKAASLGAQASPPQPPTTESFLYG